MARSTMAALISLTRDRIGDPAGGSQTFTDDQIQTALDATRLDVTPYETLIPAYSYSGTTLVYLDHYSRYAFWEDSPTLLDYGLNPLTASASELLREPDPEGKAAHWTFATTQINVRARGHSFDMWGAAANLLEQRMAGLMLTTFNFTADGQTINLNQIMQNLQSLIALYRSKQRISAIPMVRQDVQGAKEWERRRQIGPVNADTPFLTGQ